MKCQCGTNVFTARDFIKWSYTHHLNSRSKTQKTKYGYYFGLVKHTIRYNGPQLAVVQFFGNKRTSRVPLNELKEMSKRRKNLYKAQKDIKDNF